MTARVRTRSAPLALALTLAAAGSAHARPDPEDALARAVLPTRSDAHAVATPDESAPEPSRGLARTAIDHRFDRRTEAAVGFLCGIQDARAENGGTAVLGRDPHGRFLGAQVKLAFR